MYNLVLYDEVEDDFMELPDEVAKEALEYFEKFKSDPYKCSLPLHNQGNLKLKGYRKTYLANSTYRIVLHIEKGNVKIVEVIAVGKRKDKEVYINAFNRITSK